LLKGRSLPGVNPKLPIGHILDSTDTSDPLAQGFFLTVLAFGLSALVEGQPLTRAVALAITMDEATSLTVCVRA